MDCRHEHKTADREFWLARFDTERPISLRQNYFWENYSLKAYLSIVGTEMENLPGQWRIEAYLDNQLKFQIEFQIVSTKITTTQATSKYVVQTAEWTMPTEMTSTVTSTAASAPFLDVGVPIDIFGLGLTLLGLILILLWIWRSRRWRYRRERLQKPRDEPTLPEPV